MEETLKMLGRVIPADAPAGRDAVHIAVLPAVAGTSLTRGCPAKIGADGLLISAGPDDMQGVVDPFLPFGLHIRPGYRVWLYLKPMTVSTLRHVWTHPTIPDETTTEPVRRSERDVWLEQKERTGE